MHTHYVAAPRTAGTGYFSTPRGLGQLSTICLQFMAGLLRHAKGFCAVAEPPAVRRQRLVRLGYEAPTEHQTHQTQKPQPAGARAGVARRCHTIGSV